MTVLNVIFFAVLFLLSVGVKSQDYDNSFKRDTQNLYYQVLKLSIEDTLWKKDTKGIIYLKEKDFITDSICSFINDLNVESINLDEFNKVIQKNKSAIILDISPIIFKNGSFIIYVTPFHAFYNKKTRKYEFLNSGGYTATFSLVNNKMMLESFKKNVL
jgi:hypothetical protein